MSIATVVTRGYGSFGSVNLVPTLGYGINNAAALVYGPVSIVADVFIPFPETDVLIPMMASDVFIPRPEVDVELP